jgi:phenylalanyl-tRNA synthetase beta chain
VFKKTNNQLKEFEYISGIFSKELYRNNWQLNINDKEFNWFDAKGLLQEVFEKLDLAIEWQLPETEIENDLFQLNRTSELYLNGEKVGVFSQLHPRVALKNEILLDTFLFELDLNCLSSKQNKDVVFANYFDYPTIVKDIAFSVPVTTTFMSIKETIKKSSGDLLDSISLIDEYKGKQVDEGSKSLTIKLIFKSSQRTLTNTEIDQLVLNINQQLNEDLAAVLR